MVKNNSTLFCGPISFAQYGDFGPVQSQSGKMFKFFECVQNLLEFVLKVSEQ